MCLAASYQSNGAAQRGRGRKNLPQPCVLTDRCKGSGRNQNPSFRKMHDSCSDAHTPACCCVSALPVVSGIFLQIVQLVKITLFVLLLVGVLSFPVSHPTYIVFWLKADVV